MTSAPSQRRKLSTSVETSNVVDEYLTAVERYEIDELGEERTPGEFTKLREIATRWRKFAAAVEAIERALINPTAPGAYAVLLGAEHLGERINDLYSLVARVGEATATRGDPFALEVLREFGVATAARRK